MEQEVPVLKERIDNLINSFNEYKADNNKKLDEILKELQGFNGRIDSVANSANLANQKAQEAKIIAQEAKEANVLLMARVTALESRNQLLEAEHKGQKETLGWFWKALIGLGAILGIVNTVVGLYVDTFKK